jgi:hypothetical protein
MTPCSLAFEFVRRRFQTATLELTEQTHCSLMRLLSQISADEVICAFLSADLGSPRDCSDLVRSQLAARGMGPEVLDYLEVPAGVDPALDLLRRTVLCECHGLTLAGFPSATTTWHRAELLDDDELFLMDYWEFCDWTGDTLRPGDAIAGFQRHRTLDHTVEAMTRGEAIPPPICVARDASTPAAVLDGSQRASARAHLGLPRPEPILLGISADIADWKFFPRRHIH